MAWEQDAGAAETAGEHLPPVGDQLFSGFSSSADDYVAAAQAAAARARERRAYATDRWERARRLAAEVNEQAVRVRALAAASAGRRIVER